jgi:hypothetical protein
MMAMDIFEIQSKGQYLLTVKGYHRHIIWLIWDVRYLKLK